MRAAAMDKRLKRGPAAPVQRLLLGMFLALAAGFSAWFFGSLFAARYLVPVPSGLEGAATVVLGGVAAALVAIAAAVVLAWRAPPRTLLTATVIALFCAIGAASLLHTLTIEQTRPGVERPQSPTALPTQD